MVNIISINFPLIGEAELIVVIVLAFLMYYLTNEIFKIENIILYGDLIFIVIWTVASTTSISQAWGIPLFGLLGMVFYFLWLTFVGVSALLVLVSYLLFIKKYLAFKDIKNKYSHVEDQYNDYENGHKNISSKISSINDNLKKINKEINNAIDRLEDAKRAPEKIILSKEDSKEGQIIPAQFNTIILGLGGTGTALVSGIGIQGEQNYLKSSVLDNLISRNIIKEGNEPFLFILYDTNVSSIVSIKDKYNDPKFSNMIRAFEYQITLSSNNITAANPYLVNQEYNVVNGTGNNRILGKSAYNVIKEQFLNDIKNSIQSLLDRTHLPNTVIFVLNSWGGGTGSGTFIQFTQDLKIKLREIHQFQANPPTIYGIGVLPDKNEGQIFRANAFGALKEMTYIMKPEKIILGDVGKPLSLNPFDGYLLVSRDSSNDQRDYEIATGISNLIIDLITTFKGQGSTLRFDFNDIKRRFETYAPNNFATFEFYNIIFPASRLSWYKVIGKPKQEELSKLLNDVSKSTEDVKNEIGELLNKLNSLLTNAKTLRGNITDFRQKIDYKSFKNKVEEWRIKNESKISEVGPKGKISIENLEEKISDIESSNPELKFSLPNVRQQFGSFEATVETEYNFLKNPVQTGVSYNIPVNPDDFSLPTENNRGEKIDIGNLTNPQMNMIKILNKMKKEDYLNTAYRALQTQLGQAGPMLALNFSNLNSVMNVSNDELNFIADTNPDLVQNIRGNSVVRRPPLRDVVILPSTNPEILGSPNFPNKDAFSQALLQSSQNVEYGLSSIPYKRYTVTLYRILYGTPLLYYSPTEEPMLSLVKDYMDGYKGEYKNGLDGSSMFTHHTLFYDFDLEKLRQLGIQINERDSRLSAITKFWMEFEPLIGEEYSSKLYVALTMAKIKNTMNKLSNIYNNEVFENLINLDYSRATVLELNNFNSEINTLINNIGQLSSIQQMKEGLEISERLYRDSTENLRRRIDNMKAQIADSFNEMKKSIDELNELINQINNKLDSLLNEYTKNNKITEKTAINRLKLNLNSLMKKINDLIAIYERDIISKI
jgi:peptidoglycan hydrolase CwlO-like protein